MRIYIDADDRIGLLDDLVIIPEALLRLLSPNERLIWARPELVKGSDFEDITRQRLALILRDRARGLGLLAELEGGL